MPAGGVQGQRRPKLTRWLISLLFRWLYTPVEQRSFLQIVREIKADPRIPAIEPTAKGGREYRRDEASIRAICLLCLKQSKANLGCELAYWLVKE